MTNHDPGMMRQELERVREWAIEKLTTGAEPPWSWYQHMKLREAIEAILSGMDATQPKANSPGSDSHRGTSLRLVGGVDSQDSVQSHQDSESIPLPM
jgi:hypothetical protein